MMKIFIFICLAANIYSSLGQITASQLAAIMPKNKHPEYLTHLNAAMIEGSITTCLRKSAFLAQLAHESLQFVYMEEIASGAAYEGRLDLGNTQPGDGVRFKGRGPIQLTGRANYREAGQALGLPLETDPKMVSTPEVGFRTSVWFWTKHKLNSLADPGTLAGFTAITRKINGGLNGQADREKYWYTSRSVLGCSSTSSSTTSCTAEGASGVCINKATCSGRSIAGLCPGAAEIQCCIPASLGSCTVNGRVGSCFDRSACTAGTAHAGLCPGATNIQCCIKY